MLPLLTFASGLVAGIVGVRIAKSVKAPESLRSAASTVGDKARQGLDQAQSGLRGAAVTSLSAIEKSSASLRQKLTPAETETAPAEATVEKAAAAKPARKRPAPRKKTAAKPAAEPVADAPTGEAS
ncbi:hypothetical protein [Magnetospirillum aberrantis]|uniref:hypothetical protein n=1 Tax=Magnetospirillum aberrantis TaxID=1105283 RepID=UPI00197C2CF2|nr:hypothetical protein [Magnetospirillum aberrantis]